MIKDVASLQFLPSLLKDFLLKYTFFYHLAARLMWEELVADRLSIWPAAAGVWALWPMKWVSEAHKFY